MLLAQQDSFFAYWDKEVEINEPCFDVGRVICFWPNTDLTERLLLAVF